MADSVTEAVAVAPAGEPGEVSAIGKKDARVKRPQVPADAAGGAPVVTVVKDTNESASTAKITETPVHKKEPVRKPGISSVGLSPEVLSFLDLTLSGVAEPEIPKEGSQAAPVSPDSPEPHDVTTSYTVRDRVSTKASSSTSVEQKVAPAVQLVSTSSSAVQVAKTVCSQVVADPMIIQEEDVVSEVAVEQVSTAQEDTHQEAAVETVSKAKEVVHAEKEAPKAEDEDIAPAKATEPEKKPPVVEEPAAVATEPATVATEPAAVATEPAAVATEPAAVATEPAAEVEEPAKEEAVTETGEPGKTAEEAEEAAPTADEDIEKKPAVAAKTEWTEEQVKEWSQEGYVPMVNNMFLPSTMRVLPSPLFYIGVGVLTALVFYLTESPIMALMTLVFILVLILLARLFYLYRLHVRCAEESAGQKKSE
ncbi:ZAN [Branchiostoma lanceolatum]|uniref:ZAN protein n=1 Tax=Branchiostoma lanceolatum TaxID=7740 RepID=A0A8K0EXS4_BRALA|nr:ZAN [Branchiostoma lanceolatum]